MVSIVRWDLFIDGRVMRVPPGIDPFIDRLGIGGGTQEEQKDERLRRLPEYLHNGSLESVLILIYRKGLDSSLEGSELSWWSCPQNEYYKIREAGVHSD